MELRRLPMGARTTRKGWLMGTAVKLSEAPFIDAAHALNFAYAEETRVFCKTSTAISDLTGGTVRIAAPMTPHDRMTQASFVLSLMRRSVPEQMRDALDAYYTVPEGITLEGRKDLAIRMLSHRLWEDMGRTPDRWYLADATRGWSRHNRRHHDDTWWAKHLSTSDRTLRNWRKGWGDNQGLDKRLAHLLESAHARAGDAFRDAGLCE
jgi:hypothetical protein